MSFIATEPTNTAAGAAGAATVANDGFFPDINLDHLREAMRLDGTVTPARLRDAAIAAVLSVNGELAEWKATQVAAGAAALADIGSKIDGVSVKVLHYLAAVYRTAKADLTERYRDYDATKAGEARADQLDPTISDDRRAARWAIRDLLGVARSTIELI